MDGGIDPTTPAFWFGLGVLIVKSILTALASYLVRLKVDPAVSRPDPV